MQKIMATVTVMYPTAQLPIQFSSTELARIAYCDILQARDDHKTHIEVEGTIGLVTFALDNVLAVAFAKEQTVVHTQMPGMSEMHGRLA